MSNAKFIYNPTNVGRWAREVTEILTGGRGHTSVSEVTKQMGVQIEALVQPNVWTGPAAYQNYLNFVEVHDALLKFTNAFGNAFTEAMKKINTTVVELERTNLGSSNNLTNLFGNVDFKVITSLVEANVNTEKVTVNWTEMTSVNDNLKRINSNLSDVQRDLDTRLNKLNVESYDIWCGEMAEETKAELLQIVRDHFKKINDALNVCVNNVKTALDNYAGAK